MPDTTKKPPETGSTKHFPLSLFANRHRNTYLLSLYLGLAPVYHLPGIGDEYLRLFKAALAVAGVAVVLVPPLLSGRLRLPAWVLGPPGFLALILLSAPGLVQAREMSLSVLFVMDIGCAAAFLWCFFYLARQGENVTVIFVRALVIITALAAVPLVTMLVRIPDSPGPCDLFWEINKGFGSGETQWSISLSLFLPVVVLLMGMVRGRYAPLINITSAGILLGNLFATGGRTGFLAAAVSLSALAFLRGSRWFALSSLAAGIALIGMAAFDKSCSEHLGLDRLLIPAVQPTTEVAPKTPSSSVASLPPAATTQIITTLDSVSTNRLSIYRIGLNRIAERPLLGHGLKQVLVAGRWKPQIEIHNLWIKWAVYSGILAPLWFAIMIGFILVFAFRLLAAKPDAEEHRAKAVVLTLIVVSGLIASLFEPNILIGSFQYAAIWWAAAGVLIGVYAKERGCREWSVPFSLSFFLPPQKR